jgi:hypothetical protein
VYRYQTTTTATTATTSTSETASSPSPKQAPSTDGGVMLHVPPAAEEPGGPVALAVADGTYISIAFGTHAGDTGRGWGEGGHVFPLCHPVACCPFAYITHTHTH